nr:hypothetical protein CFP56_08820 [Quercus suber]
MALEFYWRQKGVWDFALSVRKHPTSLGSLQLHFHLKLYSSDKSGDKIQHLKVKFVRLKLFKYKRNLWH